METLNKRNLYLKWKECEIIECDDVEIDKTHWHRIAILKYFDRVYYVSIYSGIIDKVEDITQTGINFYPTNKSEDIDRQIEELQEYFAQEYDKLKDEEEQEEKEEDDG